jgi:hypothetical protein
MPLFVEIQRDGWTVLNRTFNHGVVGSIPTALTRIARVDWRFSHSLSPWNSAIVLRGAGDFALM